MYTIEFIASSYVVESHLFLRIRDLPQLPPDVCETFDQLFKELAKNPLKPLSSRSNLHKLKGLIDGCYVQQMTWKRTGEQYAIVYHVLPGTNPRIQVISFAEYKLAIDRAKERFLYEQQFINVILETRERHFDCLKNLVEAAIQQTKFFFTFNQSNVNINQHTGDQMNNESSNGDTYNIPGQAGAVGRESRSDNNTFVQSQQKQTLTEAAVEIQQLLKNLEKTNPTTTEDEKIAYVNDETTPSFKRRAVGALQAGGETAIEEILDNPYVNVVKATIKGWIKPE